MFYQVLTVVKPSELERMYTLLDETATMGLIRQSYNSGSTIKSPSSLNSSLLTANGDGRHYMASDQFGDHYRRQKTRYPHYADVTVRTNSFINWPPDKEQTVEILADAGFFYVGVQDCTRCFDCGGGLRNWLPGDIPIVEHARWFPECTHVRRRVGDDFVNNVNINYPRDLEIIENEHDNSTGAIASSKPTDFTEIVNNIVKRPCGAALLALGFSLSLVKSAITKVLSDSGWDESKVTSEKLARIALDMEEVETDTPTSVHVGHAVQATRESPLKKQHSSSESDLDKDLESLNLLEENRKLKDQIKCKVCMEEDVSIVFLPCGHLVTCSKCYSSLTHCALCQQKIAASVKAFL